jgi:hypothetical protein
LNHFKSALNAARIRLVCTDPRTLGDPTDLHGELKVGDLARVNQVTLGCTVRSLSDFIALCGAAPSASSSKTVKAIMAYHTT